MWSTEETKKDTISVLLKRIAAALQTCGWENFGMRQELQERLKWEIEGVFLNITEASSEGVREAVTIFYENDGI